MKSTFKGLCFHKGNEKGQGQEDCSLSLKIQNSPLVAFKHIYFFSFGPSIWELNAFTLLLTISTNLFIFLLTLLFSSNCSTPPVLVH